jgi:hypothetical protein
MMLYVYIEEVFSWGFQLNQHKHFAGGVPPVWGDGLSDDFCPFRRRLRSPHRWLRWFPRPSSLPRLARRGKALPLCRLRARNSDAYWLLQFQRLIKNHHENHETLKWSDWLYPKIPPKKNMFGWSLQPTNTPKYVRVIFWYPHNF